MIYCVPPETYIPKKLTEESTFKDLNDFEWRIGRAESGFMIRFDGDSYFKENTFEIELSDDKRIRVKNTNCILIDDPSFDAYCDMRNTLINGYTDDIWETIESLFQERFKHDLGMLESEMV